MPTRCCAARLSLPLSAQQHDLVSDSKQLIYEGFRQALEDGVPSDVAGILAD